MKEITKIYGDKVREVCIKENWYTHGTNEAYSKMLDMCGGFGAVDYSITLLEQIARDIYNHSDKEDLEGCENPVAYIMFSLRLNACITFYDEEV